MISSCVGVALEVALEVCYMEELRLGGLKSGASGSGVRSLAFRLDIAKSSLVGWLVGEVMVVVVGLVGRLVGSSGGSRST